MGIFPKIGGETNKIFETTPNKKPPKSLWSSSLIHHGLRSTFCQTKFFHFRPHAASLTSCKSLQVTFFLKRGHTNQDVSTCGWRRRRIHPNHRVGHFAMARAHRRKIKINVVPDTRSKKTTTASTNAGRARKCKRFLSRQETSRVILCTVHSSENCGYGLYFNHPKSSWFLCGFYSKIKKSVLRDLCSRKLTNFWKLLSIPYTAQMLNVWYIYQHLGSLGAFSVWVPRGHSIINPKF